MVTVGAELVVEVGVGETLMMFDIFETGEVVGSMGEIVVKSLVGWGVSLTKIVGFGVGSTKTVGLRGIGSITT